MIGGADVRVVAVAPGDAEKVKALRLAALRGDPEGFGSTLAKEEARPEGFWREWVEASVGGEEQRTFVLDAGGVWGGMAMVRVWPERPDEAELLAMYVAPEHRGGGGAARLCDACAAWAAERAVKVMVLAVYAGNGRARRAYEKCGFLVAGPEDGELVRMERVVAD
ncbi:GNAT family N-acetyltransferase [Conexibacter woesei]|uniref:GNAT family N-acetyltransferase n=1 Tax=Conexibacter woesei TaxID=191495 RepID=UPI0018CA4807|nr:GNAT family N-acetyltransferase [Conexibacter woesei]